MHDPVTMVRSLDPTWASLSFQYSIQLSVLYLSRLVPTAESFFDLCSIICRMRPSSPRKSPAEFVRTVVLLRRPFIPFIVIHDALVRASDSLQD
jgi:hypothetical protein